MTAAGDRVAQARRSASRPVAQGDANDTQHPGPSPPRKGHPSSSGTDALGPRGAGASFASTPGAPQGEPRATDVPRLFIPHGNVPSCQSRQRPHYIPIGSRDGVMLSSRRAPAAPSEPSGTRLTLAGHSLHRTLCRAPPVPRLAQSPNDLLRSVLLSPRFTDEVVDVRASGNCEIHRGQSGASPKRHR